MTKTCRVCEGEFPATLQFFYQGKRPGLLRGACKQCEIAKATARVATWRQKNPEKFAARKKADAAKRSTTIGRYMRAWRSDPAKRAAERDRMREWQRDQRRKHPEKHRAAKVRRRAREAGAGHINVSPGTIRGMWIRQKGLCAYCTTPLHRDTYHIDHRVPLSRGGDNERANLCLSCPPCNLSKQDLTPEEFNAVRQGNAERHEFLHRLR